MQNKQSMIKLKTLIKIRQPDLNATVNLTPVSNNKGKSTFDQSGISNKTERKSIPSKSPNRTNNKQTSRSQLKTTTPSSNTKDNLNDNVNYTIFTSKEPSGSIVCSNKPIQGKLINSSFITEKDLYEYSYALIKDSNILLFDKIYNENVKIEQIYQEQLKGQVSSLFQGQNSCLFLFGPMEGGKSYTLRGGETNQEKGLLSKTVLEILNLIEINKQANQGGSKFINYGLKLSCYQVFNDTIHDLLSKDYNKELRVLNSGNTNNAQDSYLENLSKKEVNSQKDLDYCLKEIIQFRKLLTQSLRVNDLKRKSSLVFSLIIEKRESNETNNKANSEKKTTKLAQIDLVELPSSNNGLPPETEKGDVFKSISKTFNSIVNNIVSFSNGKMPKLESKLTLSLKSTLKPGSSIFFMACVSATECPLGDSYQALKFTNWMRNQVLNLNPNPEYPTPYSDGNKGIQGSSLKLNMIDQDVNNLNFTADEAEFTTSDHIKQKQHLKTDYREDNDYEPDDNDNEAFNENSNYNNNNNNNDRVQTFTNLNYGTNSKSLYNTPNLPSYNLNTNVFKNASNNNLHQNKKINYQNPYYLNEYDQTTNDVSTGLINPEITPISGDNKVHFISQSDVNNRDKVKAISEQQSNNTINNTNTNNINSSNVNRSTNNNDNFENTFISNNDDNPRHRTINNSTLRNSGSYKNIQSNSRYSNDFNNSYNANVDNQQVKGGFYNNNNTGNELKHNQSTLNIEALEKQLSDIEKTKREVAKYLDAIRAERGSLDSKSNSNYEVSKLVQENQTLKSDNIIFREDLSRLTELNQRLEEDLIRQRNRNLELANDIEMLYQEKLSLKAEVEKQAENFSKVKTQELNQTDLINVRYQQENKIKELETENRSITSEKQKIEIELRVTQERLNELKKTYETESQENKFIRQKHNEEILSIENKFDKMAKQIEQLTYDNNNMRMQEEKQRMENFNLEKQKESFREKYQDYKNRYKIMNTKLVDLESEFRSALFQKEQESYEKRKDEEVRKQKFDSKQKILEDFQSKINSYKSQLLMNRNRREEN